VLTKSGLVFKIILRYMALKQLLACLGRAFFKLHLNCKCSRCCECDSDCFEGPEAKNTPPPSPHPSPHRQRILPKIPISA